MYSRWVIPNRVVRFKWEKLGVANRLASSFREVQLCRNRSGVSFSAATLHNTHTHRNTHKPCFAQARQKNQKKKTGQSTQRATRGAEALKPLEPADTGGGGRRRVGGVGGVTAESHSSVDNESVIHSIAHKLGETSASVST